MKIRVRLKLRDYVLLSILLHGAFFLGTWLTSLIPPPPRTETLQMEILDSAPPAAVATEETGRKAKPVEIAKHQVVDQDDHAVNDEVPTDARFLSKNNQVVKKQTVAQNRGDFKNKTSKQIQSGNQGTQKTPSLQDFKPTFDIAKAVEAKQEEEHEFEKSAEDGIFKPKTHVENRQANQAGDGDRPKSEGGEASQTLDYIKDLDPGMETMLSTKEFIYYSYFNRIRTQLNQHWSGKVREQLSAMYKKGRMIASSDDKVTKCLVTLDNTGKLLKVQVIGVSGIYELDQAAVEAFKAAAPFPNPPKGMVDPDGTIKIRWDFVLEA